MKVFARLLPFVVFALPFVAEGAGGLANPLGSTTLTAFFGKLLQVVVQIGTPVIVLFIVYIGFLYISAGGKPEKLTKVHSYFFWAIVGSLLILGAQALSLAIQATVHDLSA